MSGKVGGGAKPSPRGRIGVTKVAQQIVDAVLRMPTAKNPQRNGACLYTAPRNPDRHCIAGQNFADNGLPVPSPQVEASFDVLVGIAPAYRIRGYDTDERQRLQPLRTAYTPAAAELLKRAQEVFDGTDSHSSVPRRWDKALVRLDEVAPAYFSSVVCKILAEGAERLKS